jgi:AcrR family transcriptional regulator
LQKVIDAHIFAVKRTGGGDVTDSITDLATATGGPGISATAPATGGRVPSQRRARERVERILAAASDLIARDGSDQLKMSEVAVAAGVSIGSLYQYFPDRSALIAALAARYFAGCRQCIAEALDGVDSVEALRVAFSALYDLYFSMFQAEPVLRDILAATQTDRTLQAMEEAESRANGRRLADVLARLDPARDARALDDAAYLVWHLGECTMRLAARLPQDEARRLVDTYKALALGALLPEAR